MLEVIIRTRAIFLYGKYISVVFTVRATWNVLIKKCSIAVAKIPERRARRTYTDSTYTTQADRASIQRQGSSTIRRRARAFSPLLRFPAVVSHAIHARKESSGTVPLDSDELAGDVRRKKRSGGERWERRAETTATGARRGWNRRRNKNKRREAIRLKVWTGTR